MAWSAWLCAGRVGDILVLSCLHYISNSSSSWMQSWCLTVCSWYKADPSWVKSRLKEFAQLVPRCSLENWAERGESHHLGPSFKQELLKGHWELWIWPSERSRLKTSFVCWGIHHSSVRISLSCLGIVILALLGRGLFKSSEYTSIVLWENRAMKRSIISYLLLRLIAFNLLGIITFFSPIA